MDLKELEQLYLKRQSCRSFSDTVVPDELLREICRIALLAPSACNAQPWKLYLVTGERKNAVAACLQELGMNKFASKASALVAVTEGKSNLTARAGAKLQDNEFTRNDLGILTAHLVLAAEAAGVGSCIIGWRNEEKLRAALGLKWDVRIPEVVALGYPEEGCVIREKRRKPLDEVLIEIK